MSGTVKSSIERGIERRIEKRSRRGIFQAFLESAREAGGGAIAIVDGDGKKYTYRDLSRASFALSGPMSRMSARGETLGVLLPTGAAGTIALFALHASGRVPAMLNFSAGARNLKSACAAAQIKTIITARKFVEIGGLHDLVDALGADHKIVYLEDLKASLTWRDKARAVAGPMTPTALSHVPHPDDTGVILFTSGTEGAPKGVVLSHANIIANAEQINSHVELLPSDRIFNPLPMFHCYGLTAGTMWPLLSGRQVALHPSPLQTKIIAKRIFETGSTILFATDTFLQQYMRASADGGMSSLRLAVCGAERVREETRQIANQRFSFEVLEGYGVTEGAPVLACNQPGAVRSGTIGKFLPAIDHRIAPVPGLNDAGKLLVRGPNIMKGYISEAEPGAIKPPRDGWHDTGDVVSIDADGYITIRGRMKRFAKIGGEMVSLTVVENCAAAVWPGMMHAAAILPDKRIGDQIVLLTEKEHANAGELLSWAQKHGVPELAVPKKLFTVDAIPVLGTGKTDYASVSEMAKRFAAQADAAKATSAAARAAAKEAKSNAPGGVTKKAAE